MKQWAAAEEKAASFNRRIPLIRNNFGGLNCVYVHVVLGEC